MQVTTKSPIIPSIGNVNGVASGWSWHAAAVKDGKVFDKLTGVKGLSIDAYKKLFDYADDLNFDIVDTRTLK